MSATKARRVIGIIILIISLLVLLWGLWPFANQMRVVPVSPDEMLLPTPSSWLPWLVFYV